MKNTKKLVLYVSILAFATVLIIMSGIVSYRYVNNNLNKSKEAIVNIGQGKKITVIIPYNSDTTSIANILKSMGIIRYPLFFRVLSKINGYDGTYQAGTHILCMGLEYEEIMSILAGKPVSTKITIPEGYTYIEIANKLSEKKLVSKDKFELMASNEEYNYEFLKDIPKRQQQLEGYLFPDTYEFDVGTGEKEIIRRMLDNFNNKFIPEYYIRAKTLKMAIDQIITLASIVEREARKPEERKIIAGVFYNRLNSSDRTLRRLQSCATIQYICFYRDGIYKERITEKDTQIPDPYNTYINEGLPPGPICSPGKASIEAVLYPEKSDYLFFVAKGDGYHRFSKTYNEHLQAIKKYGVK